MRWGRVGRVVACRSERSNSTLGIRRTGPIDVSVGGSLERLQAVEATDDGRIALSLVAHPAPGAGAGRVTRLSGPDLAVDRIFSAPAFLSSCKAQP